MSLMVYHTVQMLDKILTTLRSQSIRQKAGKQVLIGRVIGSPSLVVLSVSVLVT
jgi:hypothetical protein